VNAFKSLLKKTAVARTIVRQYRLRSGQPKWASLLAREPIRVDAGIRSPARRKILIATGGGGYLAATRVESLLAVALTQRGAECQILLCDGLLPACFQCSIDWERDERRYAMHGPTRAHCDACFAPAFKMYSSLGVRVHRYSELLCEKDFEEAALLASSTPAEEISTYSENGIPLGEHAMAGALRYYARAELQDPYSEAVLRRYLKAAKLAATATRNLQEREGFDAAVLHHGIYVPQGVTAAVLRQHDVAITTWHVAYRKKTFIFSHGDTYHHTLMEEPVGTWLNMAWTSEMERQIVAYLNSRWHGTDDWIHFNRNAVFESEAFAKETGADLAKPTIGMLTNVMWDAQLHYPANAFPNMLAWAIHTIRQFERRPDLQLVIRVHPAEITGTIPSRQRIADEIARVFPILPSNVFIVPPESKLSTYALMTQCNGVIIYGTKTGVELTSMGIPVIVAGEAWIRNKGLSLDAQSVEEYDRMLDELPFPARLPPEAVQRARKYAYHFFFRRMIPLEFLEAVRQEPGFEIGISTLKELLPGRSRGLDVICDGVLLGSEYVYPAEREPQEFPSASAAAPTHASGRVPAFAIRLRDSPTGRRFDAPRMSFVPVLVEKLRSIGRIALPRSAYQRAAWAYDAVKGVKKMGWREYQRFTSDGRSSQSALNTFRIPPLQHPLTIRRGTTDATAVTLSVIRENYAQFFPSGPVKFIIDAGAYIGDTAAWYLSTCPAATVVSLEPDDENFRLLDENCRAYGPRSIRRKAGIWPRDAFLRVRRTGEKDSTEVHEVESGQPYDCLGLSPLRIMEDAGFDRIDILKCNIEGAEIPLFQSNFEPWLAKTRSIYVQLHNRAAVDAAMAATVKFGFTCRAYRTLHIFHQPD
jgi:FkbM family methyltransferase